MKRILIAITGASGVIYGIKLLQTLSAKPDIRTYLILSEAAKITISYETDYTPEAVQAMADEVYGNSQIWAAPASGSFPLDSMIICPCSMKTLAQIRCGLADNLIGRCADVFIKEHRNLILCPRETPLSAIHLDNMAYLAHLGIAILPPMPAFYTHPSSVDDLISHHLMKLFDLIGVDYSDAPRWS